MEGLNKAAVWIAYSLVKKDPSNNFLAWENQEISAAYSLQTFKKLSRSTPSRFLCLAEKSLCTSAMQACTSSSDSFSTRLTVFSILPGPGKCRYWLITASAEACNLMELFVIFIYYLIIIINL